MSNQRQSILRRSVLITALITVLQGGASAEIRYTASDLGDLRGASAIEPMALNAKGEVVGISSGRRYAARAFKTRRNGTGISNIQGLDSTAACGAYAISSTSQIAGGCGGIAAFVTDPASGGFVFINSPDGSTGQALGINSKGQVVGSYGAYQAFYTLPGSYDLIQLALPGGTRSSANAINERGQIVGWSTSSGNALGTAFIADSQTGEIRNLGALGGVESSASGVNGSGRVVGAFMWSFTDPKYRPFISGPDGTNLRPIPAPDMSCGAASINNDNLVVGYCEGVEGNFAFVTEANGTNLTNLNTLVVLPDGEVLETAQAINDHGQIVATSASGRGYLLTPVAAADR